ncbi:hypothetical protein BC940DRAFT_308364 [Gongronella butleri]|nr:hypothetical protein BC940DRAFT_308364 [Gongronella butleri]
MATLFERWRRYGDYFSTLSLRSRLLSLLLVVNLVSVLLYCSTDPTYFPDTMDGFLFAQNASHLLSSHQFDCRGCERPRTIDYSDAELLQACLDPGIVPEYYLSIVMVTRNDDHAGNQRHRLQNAIDSTYLMAEHTKTRMELLLIEWNPESHRRSLTDTYRFRRSAFLTYRIITVPNAIHDLVHPIERAAVYEFEGKNLGIRHARGEFVCTTNQDDLWTPNMYNAIVSRSWRKNTFYAQFQDPHLGVQPADERPSTIVDLPVFPTDAMVAGVCRQHDLYPSGAFKMPRAVALNSTNYASIAAEASDFTLAHRDTWQRTHGYRETGARDWMDMELLLTAAWTLDLPIVHDRTVTYTCHQQHPVVGTHDNNENDKSSQDDVDLDALQRGSRKHLNHDERWGLKKSHLDEGLQCRVFRGGLGIS